MATSTNERTNQVLAERGATYGDFRDNARISQSLKDIIRKELLALGKDLPDNQREALDQACSKISRIITGNHHHEDNWRDIAGYATLVADDIVLNLTSLPR